LTASEHEIVRHLGGIAGVAGLAPRTCSRHRRPPLPVLEPR
jgi:hypothetical protein